MTNEATASTGVAGEIAVAADAVAATEDGAVAADVQEAGGLLFDKSAVQVIDDALADTASDGPKFVRGRLLVKFRDVPEQSRAVVLGEANARESGEIAGLGVKIVELPARADEHAQLRAFRGRPEVEFAELDHLVEVALIPNDPYYNHQYTPQWHLPRIGAPAAWDITTGSSNVIIAILDTGVYAGHVDLASKLVAGWNVYDNNSNTTDITGHGTLVAGQAAPVTNNATGVAGIGWNCPLMPVRVTDSGGWASDSQLATGLSWAASHGARVANMSLAYLNTSTLTTAAQYFQAAGGVVIMSAGNSGTFNPSPDNPYILTISATDSNDVVPTWSVTGNCVDLAAPGVAIITTNRSGTYSSGSGTSASAPIVAGTAALAFSINPQLTGAQVQQILKDSADDFGPAGWDPAYGWGRLNAGRAIAMARDWSGDTECPMLGFVDPLRGSTLSGIANIEVLADDNIGVASVSLSFDGVAIGTDSSEPFVFVWDTELASNGGHTLSATAVDAAGNAATATASVIVENVDATPPTIVLSAPADGGTVSGMTTIQISAGDNDRVASVSLSIDGATLATDYSAPYAFAWNTAAAANGAHTLTATALDDSGNAQSASINVMVSNNAVDTIAPQISITSPADGSSVSRTVQVRVSAGDNVGVARVELLVDGEVRANATSSPFTTSWNARRAAGGNHTLQCRAYDAAGNVGVSSVVTVQR